MLGPLFFKELIETSRRKRYYASRVLVGAGILVGLWMGLAPYETMPTTAELSGIGQRFFGNWAWFVLVGVCLAVPAMASGLIAGEKDAGTLEMLLTTCLEDGEILTGKLASRLLAVLTLILCSLPAVSLASLYGGFGPEQVVAAVTVQATVAIFAATVGLYYSTVTQKGYVALIRTYMTLALLWYVVPIVPHIMWNARGRSSFWLALSPFQVMSDPASTNPVVTLQGGNDWIPVRIEELALFEGPSVVANLVVPVVKTMVTYRRLLLFVAMYGTLAVWFYRRSRARLRQTLLPTAEPLLLRFVRRLYRGLVDGSIRHVERRRHESGYRRLWDLEVKSRRWCRLDTWLGESRNPLRLRNANANVYDPEKYVITLQIAAWILFWALVYYAVWINQWLINDREYQASLLMWEGIGLLLFTIVLGSASFVRERQSGSWDVLLLTELTPGQFIGATATGIARTLRPTLILLVVTAFLIGYAQLRTDMLFIWFLQLVVCLHLFLVMSMINSLISERVGQALGLTLLSVALLALCSWVTATMPAASLKSQVTPGIAIAWLFAMCLYLFGRHRLAIWMVTLLVPLSVGALVDLSMGVERFSFSGWRLVRSIEIWNRLTAVRDPDVSKTVAAFVVTVTVSTGVLAVILHQQFERLSGRIRQR